MNLKFFTENVFSGRPPLHATGRTDMNWIYLLGENHPFHKPLTEMVDIGIIIIPKVNPETALEFYRRFKSKCHYWLWMQEADQTYWQTWNVSTQFEFIEFITSIDAILCHNENDVNYFGNLFNKPAYILPTVMITDNITLKSVERHGVMINGTLCQWYNGMDSLIIAQHLDEPVYAPSMGRKTKEENFVDEMTYIPYSNWQEWMVHLNSKKYAINLMRTAAAGSFSLNCAYLGIPCIGWNMIDTQRKCFPELSRGWV